MKTREEALAVLKQYNESEALLRHGYAVEGVMRHFAALKGEDVEYWGQVGLLHDVDYEKWPEEHLKVAPRLLAEAGYDEAFIHAVAAHGYGLCTDVKPELYMEKVLYTIDELTGLITATAYMRPSRSVMEERQEEIQGQRLCRGREPRRDPRGLRHARHDARRSHCGDDRRHARRSRGARAVGGNALFS